MAVKNIRLRRWLNDFVHNALVHPVMPLLPVHAANRLHDWHASRVFSANRVDELSLEGRKKEKTMSTETTVPKSAVHAAIPPHAMEWLIQMQRVLRTPPPALAEFRMTNVIDPFQVQGNVCGFTACAIGTAALDPWFNAWGLTSHANYYDWTGHTAYSIRLGGRRLGWGAIMERLGNYLELPDQHDLMPHTENLFGGNYRSPPIGKSAVSTTPEDVAQAIDYYLRHAQPPEWAHGVLRSQ